MQRFWILAFASGAIAGLWPSLAGAACQLKVVSEYHITMNGNRPLVDASINGQPVRFLVDMGAASTTITPHAAELLGLHAHRMSNRTMYGVGGGEVPGETVVQELKIGNEVARNIDLMVVGRALASEPFVGLMGQDLLSQADVELDFANNAMRIIKPSGCGGDEVVYWGKAYSLASIVPSNNPKIVKVYVALNGFKAEAQIDTGAYTSIVTTGMAQRAGVTPQTEGVRPDGQSSGIAGPTAAASVATFSSLAVGDESVRNAKLRIADMFHADTEKQVGSLIATRVTDFPDMLLGADFIRAHRIYVARSQGKMYFSYNGGPIFQVVGPPAEDNPTPSGKSASGVTP